MIEHIIKWETVSRFVQNCRVCEYFLKFLTVMIACPVVETGIYHESIGKVRFAAVRRTEDA